jgi:opacity protein-like surface antigen
MKKLITIASAALLATSVAGGAAFAQANPNAQQPGSTGQGTYKPGTAGNGQAIDTNQTAGSRHATTGMSKSHKSSKMTKSMDSGKMKNETER